MALDFAGGGTVINVVAIIIGGIAGLLGGKFLTEKIQQTLQMACATAVIFIGISGTLENYNTLLVIAGLIGGGLIGEIINIDGGFEKFGVWLRNKSGNDGDSKFVDGFVTASLTVCIGAMAVIGAITIFAGFLEPVMTEIALKNLSCVGSALIFCVGINLMFGNKIRVANLLPALIVAIFWE